MEVQLVPHSPLEALGSHAIAARDLVMEVVRTRHSLAAGAHAAAGTRYRLVFGGQWRDLLEDTVEAFTDRGHDSHKLTPAGYSLPIVNGCLVFVWRVPAEGGVEGGFATSQTRMSSFFARPSTSLFGKSFIDGGEATHDESERADLERALQLAGEFMPVVLVMVHSTPQALNSIDWAVAEYVGGAVELHGEETIWELEPAASVPAEETESFDSGVPVIPVVEAQEQDQTPDA